MTLLRKLWAWFRRVFSDEYETEDDWSDRQW